MDRASFQDLRSASQQAIDRTTAQKPKKVCKCVLYIFAPNGAQGSEQ